MKFYSVMAKTLCYSVRLESLRSIPDKAYLAKCFDGSEAIIPKSQVFGPDLDVQKSEAYWIAAWILEKKDLQYSSKKQGWYNPDTHRMEGSIHTVIERHIPDQINPKNIQADDSLTRPTDSSH
jgi:hypothetical protein